MNPDGVATWPVGRAVPDWTPPPIPPHTKMHGRYCVLEPLRPQHTPGLWQAYGQGIDDRDWTYLPNGPYESEAALARWVEEAAGRVDAQFYAIVVDGRVSGECAHLRISPEVGSIEVGHIHLSPAVQRSPVATEAMYLMMRRAFESGYRRYEWKCHALNRRSRSAAQRLGFSFEGIFRNATIVKGRNRDTAWFATIDDEWPQLRIALEQWLDPANFDWDGQQRTRLSDLTRPILVAVDSDALQGGAR